MAKKTSQYKVIDLFAGVGGLSLGASRAGFSVIGAVELDDCAVEYHTLNFPNTIHIHKDILKLNGNQLIKELNCNKNDIFGIIGGPPCQGFSSIGRGDVNDDRNVLFKKFFDFVKEIKPSFYLAENVPGILNSKYDTIRSEAFSKLKGYVQLPAIIVKADEYGAPTTRTRVFFIGYKKSSFKYCLSVEDFERAKVTESEKINVKEALTGLPQEISYKKNDTGEANIDLTYLTNSRLKNSYFHERVRGRIPTNVGNKQCIDNYLKHGKVKGHFSTNHSPEVAKRYATLKLGQRDKISKSVRLKPDGFCPTIRAGTGPEKGSYQAVRPIHFAYPRVITPREAARLQGFPDWFLFPYTIWHSFRQIGNSVSPIVAEQILAVIYHKLT